MTELPQNLRRQHESNIRNGLTLPHKIIITGNIPGGCECCGGPGHHKPGTKFICGRCVQLLLNTRIDTARRIYRQLVESGRDDRAAVLLQFFGEERLHYDYHRPNLDRTASVRVSRMQQESPGPLASKASIAVHQGISKN